MKHPVDKHQEARRLHTWDLFENKQKRLRTWVLLVKGKAENWKK